MSPKDALESLVLALDATSWPSWQATARFAVQYEAARTVLEQERIRDAAPDLLDALQSIVDASDSDAAAGGEIWWAEVVRPFVEAAKPVIAKTLGESTNG